MMGKLKPETPKKIDGKNPWVSGSDLPEQTNPLRGRSLLVSMLIDHFVTSSICLKSLNPTVIGVVKQLSLASPREDS